MLQIAGGLSFLVPRLPEQASTLGTAQGTKMMSLITDPEDAKDLPIISLDDPPSLEDRDQHSYSITTVVTPDQLEIMRDLSLTTSKADPPLEADVRTLSTAMDKTQMINGSPDESGCAKRDEDAQSSPGGPTPSSEAWDYWEESPEWIGYNLNGGSLLDVLSGPLDKLYQEWLGGFPCEDSSGETSSSASASSSTTSKAQENGHAQPDTKRKRGENTSDEDHEALHHKSRIVEKKYRKQTPLNKLLACPYFKKDPQRHRDCCGFGFQKISYVKGHIYEKHVISIYCPLCGQSFDNMPLRDSHTRERTCEPVDDFHPPDGITMEQRAWLHRRVPRNLSEEQQWYHVFDHLFPGHTRPRTPYNDTAFSDELLDFRDFLSQPTGQERLFHTVREIPAWTQEVEAAFRPALVHDLDQLYWAWAGTRNREAGQADSQMAVQMAAQSTAPDSPTQEPQAQSTRCASEDAALPPSHTDTSSETLGEGLEVTTAAVVNDTERQNQPDAESDDPLAIGDFELPDRKIDESEVLPRQLDHDGIALVPVQNGESFFGDPGLDDIDYWAMGSLALPDDIQYDSFPIDYNFLNSSYEIDTTHGWIASSDLRDYEIPLPIEGTVASLENEPVDLDAILAGEPALVEDGNADGLIESDDSFVIVDPPS